MLFKSIKSFQLELDGPHDAVYTSGEMVTGQVVLELNREIKVRSMRVLGRGLATAHWLENRTVGMNTVYNDYTSKITYFRKRQHLIRGRLRPADADTQPDSASSLFKHVKTYQHAVQLTLTRL